jgi:hypothetical protein
VLYVSEHMVEPRHRGEIPVFIDRSAECKEIERARESHVSHGLLGMEEEGVRITRSRTQLG